MKKTHLILIFAVCLSLVGVTTGCGSDCASSCGSCLGKGCLSCTDTCGNGCVSCTESCTNCINAMDKSIQEEVEKRQ